MKHARDLDDNSSLILFLLTIPLDPDPDLWGSSSELGVELGLLPMILSLNFIAQSQLFLVFFSDEAVI